jgi:hypothetical protein
MIYIIAKKFSIQFNFKKSLPKVLEVTKGLKFIEDIDLE